MISSFALNMNRGKVIKKWIDSADLQSIGFFRSHLAKAPVKTLQKIHFVDNGSFEHRDDFIDAVAENIASVKDGDFCLIGRQILAIEINNSGQSRVL